jgi:iron(III) transport system substrate-binding protein
MLRKGVAVCSLIGALFGWVPGVRADASVEKAKREGTVVFYSTIAVDHGTKLTKAFEKKYPGLRVQTFRGNSERVLNRVLTEGRAGSHFVDVINLDGINGWVLKEKGFLQSHRSKETDAFPEEFRDPAGLLPCCVYVLTNVIGYNTAMVSKADSPKSYADLLEPKWKGQLGMDSEESEWFTGLISIWGKEKTVDYFRRLMKQEPMLRRGHTLQAQLMAAGEFPAAVNLFGYRVLEFQERGAPVEIVQADPLMVRPWHMLLAKRAPHPNAGRLFMDYVFSEEGQQVLAGLGRTVVRPGVKLKHPRLVEGVKLYPIKPEIAKDYGETVKLFYSIVGR